MLSILHTADFHLDAPFAALPPEEAAGRRAQQRQLLMELSAICRERDCHLWLLAGDVFDAEAVRPETLDALQEAFSQCGAQVFISPGNHDPYTPSSPWTLVRWPENVHIFSGSMEQVTLPELGCRVWGAAFRGHDAYDLLRPIPAGEDGFLEVGVFHGDPVYAGGYHPISKQTLTDCGLDYLALGHIHKASSPRKLGRTWYGWPGSAVARGFDETGKRLSFLVRLSPDSCETELVSLPGLRYESFTIPAGDDPEEAVRAVLPADGSQTLCRVTLTGESTPFDPAALEAKLSGLCLSLELRDETTPPVSLWEDCGSETLRGLALQQLKDRYDAAETPQEQQIAALAARYVLAALEGRETP